MTTQIDPLPRPPADFDPADYATSVVALVEDLMLRYEDFCEELPHRMPGIPDAWMDDLYRLYFYVIYRGSVPEGVQSWGRPRGARVGSWAALRCEISTWWLLTRCRWELYQVRLYWFLKDRPLVPVLLALGLATALVLAGHYRP